MTVIFFFFLLCRGTRFRWSVRILEKDCTDGAAKDRNAAFFLFVGESFLIVSPPALFTGRVNKEDTLPLMKLKQSRCPLASKASH